MTNLNLERRVVDALRRDPKTFNLEEGLLIASGVPFYQLDMYEEGIDRIHNTFNARCMTDSDKTNITKARRLHQFLTSIKDDFYMKERNTLKSTLEGVFSKGKGVGNCAGLTSLYTILANREGLNPNICVSQNHVLNSFITGRGILSVENTCKNGFMLNSIGSKSLDSFKGKYHIRNANELIAANLLNRANNAIRTKKYDLADGLYSLVHDASGNFLGSMGLTGRAVSLLLKGQFGESQDLIDAAYELNEGIGSYKSYQTVSKILEKRNIRKFKKDEKLYGALVDIGLESAEIYRGLYEAKKALGKEMEARKYFKKYAIDFDGLHR